MNKQADAQVDKLITGTANHDPDVQYMSIKQLADRIQQQPNNLSPQTTNKILSTIIKFLDDTNKDLHALAIDRLSKVMSFVGSEHNKKTCETMISKLIDPSTSEQFQGIYQTALKSIVKEVKLSEGNQLKDLLTLAINAILDSRNKHMVPRRIEGLLIEVVDSFIGKWPNLIDKIEFPKAQFTDLLLSNIIKSSQQFDISASALCLGRLSSCFKPVELEHVVMNGLMGHLKSKASDEQKQRSFYTLKLILQNSSRELSKFMKHILQLLFDNIKHYNQESHKQSDTDRIDLYCTTLCHLLHCLTSIAQGYPKDMKEFLLADLALSHTPRTRTIEDLVTFCPGGSIAYHGKSKTTYDDDDDYDMEEEEFQMTQTFKVRKAVLLLIGSLCGLDFSLASKFADLKAIFESLLETNNQVRQESFEMFQHIINSITVSENTKLKDIDGAELFPFKRQKTKFREDVNQFLSKLIEPIEKLLNQPTIDQKSVSECCKLLKVICKSFPKRISEDPQISKPLLKTIQNQLKKCKNHQTKSNLLDALSSLFNKHMREFDPSHYLKLVLSTIDAQNSVIVSSFRAIHDLLGTYQEQMSKDQATVKQVNSLTMGYFLNNTLNTDSKKAIVQCVSRLLSLYHQYLDPMSLQNYLKQLRDRLQSDIYKKNILAAFSEISDRTHRTKEVIAILNSAIELISRDLINHQNESLADSAQEAVANIVNVLGKDFSKEGAKKLIQISRTIKRSYPKYLNSVLTLYPDIFKGSLKDIFSYQQTPVHVIEVLLKDKIASRDQCVTLLKNSLVPNKIEGAVKILNCLQLPEAELKKNISDSLWGRVCLRCLGDQGNPENFNLINSYITGEYENETRYQACIALGSLASKSFAKLVPQIMAQLGKGGEQNTYNYYVSIKQAVVRGPAENYLEIDKLFETLLHDVEKGAVNKEAQLQLISECVGKQLSTDPNKSIRLNDFLFNQGHQNLKYLAASSLRYLKQQILNDDEYMRPRIHQLSQLLREKSPVLRYEALKTLTYFTKTIPLSILGVFDDDLFKNIKQCSIIDKDLIRVEVVVIKTVIDDGKAMRQQSFILMEALIENQTNQALNLLQLHPQICAAALDDFEKETQLALVLQRVHLLSVLSKHRPDSVSKDSSRLKNLMEMRIKNLAVGDHFTKTFVQYLMEIVRNMKKEFNADIEDLKSMLQSKAGLKDLLVSINKQFE